jgi:hypothetical protein
MSPASPLSFGVRTGSGARTRCMPFAGQKVHNSAERCINSDAGIPSDQSEALGVPGINAVRPVQIGRTLDEVVIDNGHGCLRQYRSPSP